MSLRQWALIGFATVLVLYLVILFVLIAAGRRGERACTRWVHPRLRRAVQASAERLPHRLVRKALLAGVIVSLPRRQFLQPVLVQPAEGAEGELSSSTVSAVIGPRSRSA